MGIRQFYYTADGANILGPVSGDWLWENVDSGSLSSGIQVCESGTEDWILFTALPESVFSVRLLAQISKKSQKLAEAEQLHYQATSRLIDCQSYISVYGSRTEDTERTARNGLEFIEEALRMVPDYPKYLNTKALLYADGLGNIQVAISLLKQAAAAAPNDIQIRQNLRQITSVLNME